MTIQEIEITVTELSKTGNGSGKFERGSEVVQCEIPFTVPGDVVKAIVVSSCQGVVKAKLTHIITPSPLRVKPRCKHFGSCGGCRLQHVPYKEQLLYKEKLVHNICAGFEGGAAVSHPVFAPKNPWNYRGKMDFTFGLDKVGKLSLGLVQEGTKGSVINLEECHVAPRWFIDALNCIKSWGETAKMSPYDPVSNKGVLRHLSLREGRRSGDRMVILSIANQTEIDLNIRHIENFVSQVTEYAKPHQGDSQLSVILRVCQTQKGTTSSHYDMLLYGSGIIKENLKITLGENKKTVDLLFEITSSTFFQPNPQFAESFYNRALEIANLHSESIVYDLYCGSGVLGLCASKFVKQVVGVDVSSESISNARNNAKLNQCKNTTFYSGAVRHVLSLLKNDGVPLPDVVIVNPPRAGLEPEAMQRLLDLGSPAILYVSGNQASHRRNMQVLLREGYHLADVQAVDYLPQTNHVGSIAYLRRL